MDALTALVAYAREGRDTGMLQEYTMASRSLWEIFPKALSRTPHLLVSWKRLSKRLTTLIWKPTLEYEAELHVKVESDKLRMRMQRVLKEARDKGSFPPEDIYRRYFL